MLPVPEQMLNRRNKQLYQRVLGLQSQVHEKRSTIRMENGLIDDNKAQINEANRSLTLLRRQQNEIMSSTEKDKERVTKVTVEVERLTKLMSELTSKIGIVSKEAEQISSVVEDARARLKTAEEEGQRLEEVVAEWARENRETDQAEQTAKIVMSKIGQAIKQRLDHANHVSVQCRQLQDEYEEEKEASAQLRHEVAQLKEQKEVGIVEVENLKNRITELGNVCEALDEAIKTKAMIMERVTNQAEEMMRSSREFQYRAEVEARHVQDLEKLDHQTKAKKDSYSMKIRQNELNCTNLEIETNNLERQVDITVLNRDKLRNQVEHQQEQYRQCVERLDELEKLLKTVVKSERDIQNQRDNAKKADVSASALADSSQIRLNAALQRYERSQQRLRDELNKSRTAALETNELNLMINRCQKRLAKTTVEDQVEGEAVKLDERVNQMSDEVDKAAMKLAYARGLNIDDPEVIRRKALLKERVGDLEEELETVTKDRNEKDRAVRSMTRRVTAETASGNFLQVDIEQLQSENVVLKNENEGWYREIDSLIQNRQQRASTVESLWAKINSAEQRLAGKAGDAEEAAAAKLAMERETATRLAQIEADRNALQQLLNNQENERHRTAMRLLEMKDTSDILKARYNGVVQLLQTKLGDAEEVTDEMSAEQMQAKMMMQRAEKREELQSRGDDLDQKIYAVEKEILILDRALNQAREHSMDFAPLMPPPELDAAWQVVQRVDQERKITQQARELEQELEKLMYEIQNHDQRAVFIHEKHAAMEEARRAAGEEVAVLQRELKMIQKSKHLTTVEHNRARAVSKKLIVTSASAVPVAKKRPPSAGGRLVAGNNNNSNSNSDALPRMPKAQALHQALSGISAAHYRPQRDKY